MLSEEEIRLKIEHIKGVLTGMDEGWSQDREIALKAELDALKYVLQEI